MNNLKKITALLCAAILLLAVSGCAEKPADPADEYKDAHVIALDEHSAMLDGEKVEEYDYTWHCDPTAVHDEVKNAPAEYHTGTAPDTDAAAYIDSDLAYYPLLDENAFVSVNYDGEQEWAYYYQDGENDDFIFATLPKLGASLPTQMMHTEKQAAENRVLHITKPGSYILQGSWKGQIRVELGDKDETFTDENAKVTLILGGAEISCSVAPGVVFYSVYEFDNGWEERTAYSEQTDTADAGATLVIADGTQNEITGTNVFRMLKTKYKDEDDTSAVKTQKKQRKTDGALYSYVTMNILGGTEGTGSLTVNSGFEGIDSELHLSFLGGNITVNSDDDGVNVNEDNVSVVSFLGGSVTLNPAQGAEGDGVDSNGYIVIDGGSISVNGVRVPDNAMDSECGIYYKSGTVTIDGTVQQYTAGDTFRETGTGGFGGQNGQQPPEMGQPGMMQTDFDLAKFKEQVAALPDNATLEDVLALLGMGQPQNGQPGGQQGMTPPDGQPGQQPPEPPEGNVTSSEAQPPEPPQP